MTPKPLPKIPILIVTGFLGSGKTTLINKIISLFPTKKIAVVINEFGEVGIDNELIHSDENITIQLSNGCVCCTVREDLVQGVQQLITTYPDIEYIIIETSGLSQLHPVAQSFYHNIMFDNRVYLDSIVCTVDSINFVNDWNSYEVLSDQVTYSDTIVVTKTNSKSSKEQEVIDQLTAIRSNLTILTDSSRDTDYKLLLDTHSFELTEIKDEVGEQETYTYDQHNEHNHSHNHSHEHNSFDEVVYISNVPLKFEEFDQLLDSSLMKNVIRAKGFVTFDNDDTHYVLQVVGHGKQLTPYNKTKLVNKIVFIGKSLSKEQILTTLASIEST